MPRYLISGKNDRGQTTMEAVKAPNPDEAVRRFKARGFIDVVLHSDEVLGQMLQPEALKRLSPGELHALGRLSRWQTMGRMIVRVYRKQWWLFAAAIALVLGRRIIGVPWNFLDTLAIAFLGLPAAIVVMGEFFNPARKYDRVMTYNAWARWAEMLAALPSVRWAVPALQYAFHEAKALAGLGRIDEALDRVKPFADDPRTPAWLYWGQLADVYSSAQLGERVIECGEKAVENAPNNVTVLIDLAMSLLRYRRDAARAKPLLEQARTYEISDVILPFLLMCEGAVALEEKKPDQARKLIECALLAVEKYRHASPLMGAGVDRMHTYLALACAASGDSLAAKKYYRIAEPRLKAFDATDLIERCQAVIGRGGN
ncbi:MAG: hypothetical protein EXS09_12215 [Gemmataceae bacterium]|nr:hypothetical protein [Gemmataceae bacterium]